MVANANDNNVDETIAEQVKDAIPEVPVEEDEPELTKEQKAAAISTLMNEGHRAVRNFRSLSIFNENVLVSC